MRQIYSDNLSPIRPSDAARFNTFATVATVVAAVGGAASLASMGYAAANQPSTPNLAASSAAVARAQAGVLPWQRQIAAAEQQGGSALRQGYKTGTNGDQLRQKLQNQINRLEAGQNQSMTKGGANKPLPAGVQSQIQKLQDQLDNIPQGSGGKVYLNNKGQVVPQSEAMANFQGYGTADIEGQLAKQYAGIQEQLGAKYGTQFAEEAAKEAALADPQGTAARAAEYNLLQKGPPPINPISPQLEGQVDQQVQAGRGLDQTSQDLLNQQIQNANAARGGNLSAGDVANQMSTGYQGEARLENALNKGLQVQSAGVTPGDIDYRRSQQNIANYGAFVNGSTPQSQFANLSAAGTGATPFYPGSSLPGMAGGADQSGTQYGVTSYQQQVRAGLGAANPWMAGLSGLMTGAGTLQGLGGP